MKLTRSFLENLIKKYGDSFFLLDMEAFKKNYDDFLLAFRNIYPRTNIAYSYKTNYLPPLCRKVQKWGGYAEVVSRMEYDLARRLGVPAHRIIFNGPYKTEADLMRALISGSIVNVDSHYEIDILEKTAKQHQGSPFRIGVRCNFDIRDQSISRFGFDVESPGFPHILERIRKTENTRIAGLHCHYSTNKRSAESYSFRAKKMLQLAKCYFNAKELDFIDIGGGFFGRMPPELNRQFGVRVPDFQEYAEAIAGHFSENYGVESGPELILEPGVALSGDVMRFVARVIDLKRIRNRKIALAAGSVYNVKPTLNRMNLPLSIIGEKGEKRGDGTGESTDIVGYTCTEDDCLYQNYRGDIQVNDYVVFHNVGAYTIVLKPPFIQPCPAVLSWESRSNKIEVVKKTESFDHVFSTYKLD